MKRSIRHLPTGKQDEIKQVVSFITKNRTVEMVILFGSYARGSWVEDKYTENGTTYEYKSDYDVLVVVVDEERALRVRPARKLRNQLKRHHELSAPVNVIYHGIDYLNQEIENGNYFFTDILKEGIRLYHSKKYVLAKPKNLHPKDRVKKAQLYFEKWFENAEHFVDDYESNLAKRRYSKAAFELHQATERYYMTVLLVFTDYKPKTHDLEDLDSRTRKLDARFKRIFPRTNDNEERLFNLLKKAYIDSRYKIGNKIEKAELEYLAERGRQLQQLTEMVCGEKIGKLRGRLMAK